MICLLSMHLQGMLPKNTNGVLEGACTFSAESIEDVLFDGCCQKASWYRLAEQEVAGHAC